MDNKSFDDKLKQSMDTPRDFEFDEGAWSRMEEKLPPSSSFTVSSWWKFVPFMVAILGLMGWNLSLQNQIQTMKKLSNNVVNIDTIIKKEYVYQFDTIYQVQEKNIYHYIESSKNEYISEAKAKDLDESLNYNPFSISNNVANNEIAANNAKNNSNASMTTDVVPANLMEQKKKSSNTFSDKFNQNYIDSELNTTDVIPENSLTAIAQNNITQNFIAKAEALTAVETIPLSNIKNYKNRLNTTVIEGITKDAADARIAENNKKGNSSKILSDLKDLSRRVKPQEFRIGGSTSSFISIGSGFTGAAGGGVTAGVNILKDISLEMGFSRMVAFSSKSYWELVADNPYPQLDHSQIPVNATFYDASINIESWMIDLGLRKTWFKDEHIRPYVEGGWVGIIPIRGYINYAYSVNNQTEFIPSLPINSSNTNLKAHTSPIYLGTGLSSKLWRDRVIFDVGVKYMLSLNPNRGMFDSDMRDVIGVNVGLSYQFGGRRMLK